VDVGNDAARAFWEKVGWQYRDELRRLSRKL